MTFRLVPLDDHRHNLSDKAIQTQKYHFIGVLSGTAESFTEYLWCQMISQSELQLLLLCQTKTNPKISAYEHVYGPYYYNTTPFVSVSMDFSPQQAKASAQSCQTLQQRLRRWYLFQPLPRLDHVDKRHAHHTRLRHSFTQTQISHSPSCHHFRPRHRIITKIG